MEFMPGRVNAHSKSYGFGVCAAELRRDASLGYSGSSTNPERFRVARPATDRVRRGCQWRATATTDRLILRRWQSSDRRPFAELNGDPRVMEFMPGVLSREQSDLLIDRMNAHFEEYGFGLCAAELRRDQAFIGFVGLAVPAFSAPFTPCVEIGWRLAPA